MKRDSEHRPVTTQSSYLRQLIARARGIKRQARLEQVLSLCLFTSLLASAILPREDIAWAAGTWPIVVYVCVCVCGKTYEPVIHIHDFLTTRGEDRREDSSLPMGFNPFKLYSCLLRRKREMHVAVTHHTAIRYRQTPASRTPPRHFAALEKLYVYRQWIYTHVAMHKMYLLSWVFSTDECLRNIYILCTYICKL